MLGKTFIHYSIGYVLLTLASSMLSVAVGWHIYQATGNPFDLALVGLMQILPIAGLFIVAGWVADNFSRNRVLVACHRPLPRHHREQPQARGPRRSVRPPSSTRR